MTNLEEMETADPETGQVNAVIESPKGGRNKFNYEPGRGLFRLAKVLPAGSVFPFDTGFLPSTRGEDGNPLDVLVLMDEPAFPGCLVEARLIGVIQAEQTEQDGATMRNDRLIAVATVAQSHKGIEALDHLEDSTVAEIEQFFVSYNTLAGKEFRPTGRGGPDRARELMEEGSRRYAQE